MDISPADGEIAERIHRAREAAGLSVAEVSRLVAVKPETYRRWESGACAPRINKLNTLAGVTGVTAAWLIGGDSEHRNAPDRDEQLSQLRARVEQLGAMQQRIQVMLDELVCDLDDLADSGSAQGGEHVTAAQGQADSGGVSVA